ncbi:MAG: 2-oxoglutarate ferredoxin oxidoreductase subunit beta [Halioglobus sp.]|jgi:2-oxoglutarate ferredoxin oxidoreductase subunit beta
MKSLVAEGIKHKGFSMIHVLSPCLTFNKTETYERYYDICTPFPQGRDKSNLQEAVQYAMFSEEKYLGVFYQEEAPVLGDAIKSSV